MKGLYQKNELYFSLAWIGIYVLLFSLADNASTALGISKVVTAPVCLLLAWLLLRFIEQNGLWEKYGFVKPASGAEYLLYLPLIALSTLNLWQGLSFHTPLPEALLFVLTMLCVALIEEILFRGFLLQAMVKLNLKRAVLVVSLTFGLGHIVNLLNGAPMADTLLQLAYATAIGFLYVVLVLKGKSLWPPILSHAFINASSLFARVHQSENHWLTALLASLLALGYAFYILYKAGGLSDKHPVAGQ